jgi:hypothetical protein
MRWLAPSAASIAGKAARDGRSDFFACPDNQVHLSGMSCHPGSSPCMQHPGTGREMLYGIRRAVTHARSVMIIGASGCAMLVG